MTAPPSTVLKKSGSRTCGGVFQFGNGGAFDHFDLFLVERRIFAVPRRVNGADAVGDRRMRGHEAEERFAQAVAEKHVAQVGRVLGFELRTKTVAADFLERAGKAAGIARKLHGRGVGEKFALPADGGLDQPAEENADGTRAAPTPGR